MATVEWKGLGSGSERDTKSISYAMVKLRRAGVGVETILETVGIESVGLTQTFIQQNKVQPKTSIAVLLKRRTRKKKPTTSGTTLLDTGLGWRHVSYAVKGHKLLVGYPRGYMSAHHRGVVPNVRQRKSLRMMPKKEILQLVVWTWQKKIGAR